MSTHNQYFEKKFEIYQNILSENFPFLVVKFSIYLMRRIFVMNDEHHIRIAITNIQKKKKKYIRGTAYLGTFS